MKNLADEMISAILRAGKKKLIKEKNSVITQGEIGVLFYLHHSNTQYLNPKKLTEILHISKSMVTSILNSLEKKEYIKRNLDQKDKRKIEIVLTDKGINFINNECKKIHVRIEKIIEKIGIEDSKKFIEILNKLTEEDIDDKII